MGGYLGLSSSATAGTKRLGKVLRSLKWSAGHIDRFLLAEASTEVERLQAQGKRILCLFDGSVLEKPESRHLEATAPVLSSKAKRLNRSRLGLLFNLPSLRPIRVMGMEWTGTIIVRFVIRWIKKHIFIDQEGREKKLWEIGRGKRYLAHQLIRESSSGLKLTCDLWWTPLRHPKSSQQLYLVKARLKGHVCYLITNERVQNEAQAWEIFFAYKRRWQIETSFRSGKCELALESPRLWSLDNRLKLLGIVLLVYAFLLFLLEEVHSERVHALLRLKCHRTGRRAQEALVPLYRLRWALSRLWNDCRPILGSILPPNLQTLQALALLRC
jgi:hypothetical protein